MLHNCRKQWCKSWMIHYNLVFLCQMVMTSDNQLKLRTMGSDLLTQGYTSCVMISHWSEVFNLTTKDGTSWVWSFSQSLKWPCGEISSKWMFVIWASECGKDLGLQSLRPFSDLRFWHACTTQWCPILTPCWIERCFLQICTTFAIYAFCRYHTHARGGKVKRIKKQPHNQALYKI